MRFQELSGLGQRILLRLRLLLISVAWRWRANFPNAFVKVVMSYSKGDAVVLIYEDRTVEAVVQVIAGAGMLIGFDAIIGGHVGSMPLRLQDAARGLYLSVDGTEVTIRRKLSS
jgi:hypothetical protein